MGYWNAHKVVEYEMRDYPETSEGLIKFTEDYKAKVITVSEADRTTSRVFMR